MKVEKKTYTANASLDAIFTGAGEIVGIGIDSAESGAAIELFDTDDNSYGIKPDLDVKGRIDYDFPVEGGLKATITGSTTIRVHVYYRLKDVNY